MTWSLSWAHWERWEAIYARFHLSVMSMSLSCYPGHTHSPRLSSTRSTSRLPNTWGGLTPLRAIRRFMTRRGKPKGMRSDCGMNMVHVEKELKEAADTWHDGSPFQNALAAERIQWSFNPSGAPHIGGIWERQIRTVKRIM